MSIIICESHRKIRYKYWLLHISHPIVRALFSTLQSLTSVFGMSTVGDPLRHQHQLNCSSFYAHTTGLKPVSSRLTFILSIKHKKQKISNSWFSAAILNLCNSLRSSNLTKHPYTPFL